MTRPPRRPGSAEDERVGSHTAPGTNGAKAPQPAHAREDRSHDPGTLALIITVDPVTTSTGRRHSWTRQILFTHYSEPMAHLCTGGAPPGDESPVPANTQRVCADDRTCAKQMIEPNLPRAREKWSLGPLRAPGRILPEPHGRPERPIYRLILLG